MAPRQRRRSPRRWGWHRLDPRWADELVERAHLPASALVLDVGAGDGVITEALLRDGHHVIAFELHDARVRELRRRFGERATIVRADAADLRLPRRPFHVVANPPFAVSGHLLRRLLASGSRLQTAHLVLQRQVATRWAGTDAPGAPRWQRTFRPALGPPIPRRAFRPPPHVDARVLAIERQV